MGTIAPLLTHAYWAAGVVLGVMLAGAYPQSYETTGGGLLIRAGMTRRLIPYPALTFIGPATEGLGVKVKWGYASEVLIAPADPQSFFADLAARAPHLTWHGLNLVPAV